MAAEKKIGHMVYFTLNDGSPAGVERQLAACRRYLAGHDSVEFFGIGTRTQDLTRGVNDQSFHVGLHMIFKNRAAHDAYQTSPRHLQFIEENKPHWAQVRVFDADVES